MTCMESTSKRYSVLESTVRFINRIVNVERFKYCAAFTSLFMLIVHSFFYLNVQFSHDGLGNVYDQQEAMYIATGRWGTAVFKNLIEGLEGSPWKIGVITILFMILVTYLICDLFDFSKGQSIAAVAFLTTNLTMIAQYANYIGNCGVYSAAAFLAVFGVYLFEKLKANILVKIPLSALCLMGSMSMYPMYLALAAGLFVMTLIAGEDKNDGKFFRRMILRGIQDVIVLALGVVLLFISMEAAYSITGVEKWISYNSPFQIMGLSIADVIRKIPGTYTYIFDYFFRGNGYVDQRLMICHAATALIIVISVVWMLISKVSARKKVWSLLMLIMLPIGLNGFFLVYSGRISSVMEYSFNLVYLVPLLFLSSKSLGDKPFNAFGISIKSAFRKVLLFSFGILSLVVLWHNTVFANGAYLHTKLMYDSTARDVSMVWNDIESIEEYESGTTPVIVVGRFDNSEMDFDSLVGAKYFMVLPGVDDSSITYPGTFRAFSWYLEGKIHDIIIEGDPAYHADERIINMPTYPLEGSVCWMDDAVIVKLSNEPVE